MSGSKKLFLSSDAYASDLQGTFCIYQTPVSTAKAIILRYPLGLPVRTKYSRNKKPTHIAIAFDTPIPTFRDEIYKEYKANRQDSGRHPMRIPKVKEIINAFNIPIIELDGYEADDIIGTIAYTANKKGFEVFMTTPG